MLSSRLLLSNLTKLAPLATAKYTKLYKILEAKTYQRILSPSQVIYSFTNPAKSTRRIHLTPRLLDEFIDVKTPELPDSISEGEVKWEKKVGDAVKADEIVLEIETEKTAIPVPAPVTGIIVEAYVKTGDVIKNNTKLFKMKVDPNAAKAAPAAKPKEEKSTPAAKAPSTQTPVAPARAAPPPPPPPPAAPGGKPPAKPMAKPTYNIDPSIMITGTRKQTKKPLESHKVAKAGVMLKTQAASALLTTMQEVDMYGWMDFQNKQGKIFQNRYGVQLGYLSAFCKAAAYAITQRPIINAVINNNEIVYRNYIDMAVSALSPKGIIMPIIKNIEFMNYGVIETWVQHFRNEAGQGKVTDDMVKGATFTIVDEGLHGSFLGTAMLEEVQTCIMSVHNMIERPTIVKKQIEVRPMVYLAMTYDHRLIDGKDAALFLKTVKRAVEEPGVILAGLD